jgi:arabinose-5-phosphate isomerase
MAVLALSNSGKAPELRDLILYTRRFEDSADRHDRWCHLTAGRGKPIFCCCCPNSPRRARMAMAPTTSTTMQIALGDALAVALFERRGFTAEDYKVFHPGGQLGKNLLKVKDLMHGGDGLPVVSPKTKMSEVLVEMSAKGFGCVGVVDKKGTLLGIITDGDLRRHMSPNLTKQTAEAVMTANPRTIRPTAMAAECLAEMTRHKPKVTNLFVVNDDNIAVGVIHIHDLLRAGVV